LCIKTRILHNKLSYMWRLALYTHMENTYMTVSFHYDGRFGSRQFILKWL